MTEAQGKRYYSLKEFMEAGQCPRRVVYNRDHPPAAAPSPVGRVVHAQFLTHIVSTLLGADRVWHYDQLKLLWDTITPDEYALRKQVNSMVSNVIDDKGAPVGNMLPLNGENVSIDPSVEYVGGNHILRGTMPFVRKLSKSYQFIKFKTAQNIDLVKEWEAICLFAVLSPEVDVTDTAHEGILVHVPRPRVRKDRPIEQKVLIYRLPLRKDLMRKTKEAMKHRSFVHMHGAGYQVSHASLNYTYCMDCACRKAGKCPKATPDQFTPIIGGKP